MISTVVFHSFIFIISLITLAKGADYFVEYTARIAKRFGVSDLVIGLTVTSIGTSLPELASSLSAALQGETEIIIGNIIGSNIANIALILGFITILQPFKTQKGMHARDGNVMLASVLLFFVIILNKSIELWESIISLIIYFSYILFVIRNDKVKKSIQFRYFMKYIFDFEYIKPIANKIKNFTTKKSSKSSDPKPKSSLYTNEFWLDICIITISCAALIIGANYLIQEAVWVAKSIGVPQEIIGLTMIALGTSLPELWVSISAVQKQKGGIVVGNIIGSNIANLLLIPGICGLILPLKVSKVDINLLTPFLLLFSIVFIILIKSGRQIKRPQGVLLLLAYLSFIALSFWKGWSL